MHIGFGFWCFIFLTVVVQVRADWVWRSNSTPIALYNSPALVYFNGDYHIFFEDPRNFIYHVVSADGLTWHGVPSVYLNASTTEGPTAVVSPDGTQVHVFFRDANGNGVFHLIGNSITNIFPPANPYYIQLDVDNNPSAAIALTGAYVGRIVVVACDHNGNAVMYSVLDVDGQTVIATGNTGFDQSNPPNIVWFQNAFHVFFPESGGNRLMHILSDDGINWSQANPYYIGFDSSSGPCAVAVPNYGLVVFRRDPLGNRIFFIHTSDGTNWIEDTESYIGLDLDSKSPTCNYNPTMNKILVAGKAANTNSIVVTYGQVIVS